MLKYKDDDNREDAPHFIARLNMYCNNNNNFYKLIKLPKYLYNLINSSHMNVFIKITVLGFIITVIQQLTVYNMTFII